MKPRRPRRRRQPRRAGRRGPARRPCAHLRGKRRVAYSNDRSRPARRGSVGASPLAPPATGNGHDRGNFRATSEADERSRTPRANANILARGAATTCQQRRGRRGAGRGGPGEGPRAGAYSPARAHVGLDGFVRCATTGPVFPKGPTREALPRVEPGGKFTPRVDPWGVQVRFVHVDEAAPLRLLLHVGAQGLRGDLWTTLPCAARREANSSLAKASRRPQRRPQRLARRRAEMAAGFRPSPCRAMGNSRSRRRWEVPSPKVGPFPIGRGSPPRPLPARPRRA